MIPQNIALFIVQAGAILPILLRRTSPGVYGAQKQ